MVPNIQIKVEDAFGNDLSAFAKNVGNEVVYEGRPYTLIDPMECHRLFNVYPGILLTRKISGQFIRLQVLGVSEQKELYVIDDRKQIHCLSHIKNETDLKKQEYSWIPARIIEQRPKNESICIEALFGHAENLFQNGNYKEAASVFEKLLQQDPKSTSYHLFYGRTLYKLEEFEKAQEAFLTALSIDPHHMDSRYGYATLLYRKQDYKAAALQFSEIIKQSPMHLRALFGQAQALFYLQDYVQAKELFERALKISPDNSMIQNNYAQCLTQMNNRNN